MKLETPGIFTRRQSARQPRRPISNQVDASPPAIDDSGLIHLEKNFLLTTLNLQETNVTGKVAARLATALPKCKVTVDPEVRAEMDQLKTAKP